MPKYKVKSNLKNSGTTYKPGDFIELDKELGEELIDGGVVELAKVKRLSKSEIEAEEKKAKELAKKLKAEEKAKADAEAKAKKDSEGKKAGSKDTSKEGSGKK